MQLLHKLEQERLAILDKIGKIRFMRRGTVNEQYFYVKHNVKHKNSVPVKRGPCFFSSRNQDGKTKS